MDVKLNPIHGTVLDQNPLAGSQNPFVRIPGRFHGRQTFLPLDKDILSKHIMLLGGTGCGKTNVFYHLVKQIKEKMSPEDVMIIFDPKGDYLRLFGTAKDCMIGRDHGGFLKPEQWNIYKEIVADGWDTKTIEYNTQELSWSIFMESLSKSKDLFFPNAARDLFAAIIKYMLNKGKDDPDYRKKWLYNSELKRAFNESTIADLKAMLESEPQYSSVLSYIGDGANGQALGVYAELLGTVRKIFCTCFEEKGTFSIRNFVRNKGGRTLFIEYDISIGRTLMPLYSLFFDLALKEALGRNKQQGNVYLICDEFRLIPYLQHIDDAVNFGRSLGVKVIAGLQSIDQLSEAYGEYRARNILAGFSSVFSFRANDIHTREYTIGLYGKNTLMEQRKTLTNSIKEERYEANVVEDWDVNSLHIGEAVIGFPYEQPFRFAFDLFERR